MQKRQLPFDPSLHTKLEHPDSEEVETVLMSGSESGEVFDDLRQRYERQVEAASYQLLDGQAPQPAADDDQNSIEPPAPESVGQESEVPWYAWLLVAASFVMLLATAAAVILIVA